jgi:ariadne-1
MSEIHENSSGSVNSPHALESVQKIISEGRPILFIDESEIKIEREKAIQKAIEDTLLERDDAILAMIYLGWNTNKSETWYDNEENKIRAGIELSQKTKEELQKAGIESNGNKCLICSEKNEDLSSLNCGHKFCSDCWKKYLQELINNNPLNCIRAKCPQNGCTCIVYEKLFQKFLSDENSLKRLRRVIYNDFISNNADFKKCPNESCDLYVRSISDHTFTREVDCPCKTLFCFQCLKEAHRPCPCEFVERFMNLPQIKEFESRSENTENYNQIWLEMNTRQCPNCRIRIEKIDGCNYMLCAKCGKAFCYACEREWESHSEDHFNCNRYGDALRRRMEEANRIQQNLNSEIERNFRNDFHIRRYLNYKNSIYACKTIFEQKLRERVRLLENIEEFEKIDKKFIYEAFNTIIDSKRTLKYTYIFGFFLKNTNKREFFEHLQGLLEYFTEQLHKLILCENMDIYISNRNRGEFLKYKQEIVDKIPVINKYKNSLIIDAEDNFSQDLDYDILN